MNYNEWIIKTKTDKPELAEFITKLEVLISDSGFNCTKFENAIGLGLIKIETDITKSFINDVNAKD